MKWIIVINFIMIIISIYCLLPTTTFYFFLVSNPETPLNRYYFFNLFLGVPTGILLVKSYI